MKNIMMIILAAVAALALAACGMNEQNAGSATDGNYIGDATPGSPVGMAECLGCHSDAYNPSSLMNVVGDSAGSTGWINGAHANSDSSPTGPHSATSSCSKCHNQLQEGANMLAYEAATGIDLGGFNRDVITCESCHGSGADHFGNGYVEFPNPDASRCGQCHTDDQPSWHNAETDHIYEDLQNSQHFNGVLKGSSALCSRCHSNEGARMYKDVQGHYDVLKAALVNEPDWASLLSPIQCRTCHDPHDTTKLLRDAGNIHNVEASAEFNTCTNCHQVGMINTTSRTGDLLEPYHRVSGDDTLPRPKRTILDTHFDNTVTANIEGYVLDPTNERVCRDCHNVHLANVSPDSGHNSTTPTLVNRQWAASAHGGHIVNDLADEDGTSNYFGGVANVTAEAAPAYVHYDFKSANRQDCQRCHTSTGFKNMASNPATYDPAGNIFNATGEQREMLYCWACHKDNAGGLRASFIFNDVAPYTEPASRIQAVPDLGGANVCMSCHSGRTSGVSVTAVADFTNSSAKNSHYLAAGGILFSLVGYENSPAAGDYDSPIGFVHDNIGLVEGSWGDNGPCVGCHMKGDEGHTMEPVLYNASGLYDIPAYTETCSLCHGAASADKTALITVIGNSKLGFQNALDALKSALENNGIYPASAYPYFFTASYVSGWTEDGSCVNNMAVKNWQTGGSNTFTWNATNSSCDYDFPPTTPGTTGTGEANMGAAFNYALLSHEPGAYAHNSLYTKRIIFDSIDAIDNGTLNGTITVDEPANTWLGGGSRP